MQPLSIEIAGGFDAFEPGDAFDGVVRWNLSEAPRTLDLELILKTFGKGDSDLLRASILSIPATTPTGEYNFHFDVPLGPYSFDGVLISARWMLHLFSTHPKESVELPITIAPGGVALKLEQIGKTNHASKSTGPSIHK